METPAACNLASKMMGGMPVAALDEMSGSALQELANMISGNAATALSGKGLKVTVSAPAIHINAPPGDFAFIPPGAKIICVPLVFQDGGIFEIDILA
jgi:chemotaxis protein CheX